MEVHNGSKFMLSIVIVEFLATIPLMLAYNLDNGHHMPELIWFVMFTIVGHLTGGALNPAITLGVYIE